MAAYVGIGNNRVLSDKSLVGLMEFTGSPVSSRTTLNKHTDLAGTEIKNMSWSDKYSAFSAAATEPLIARAAWWPAFNASFKSQTGVDFDMRKFENDPNYRYDHSHEMRTASRYADNSVYSIIGPPHIGFRRRMIKPFGIKFDTDRWYTKGFLTFSSFPRRDFYSLIYNSIATAKAMRDVDMEGAGRAMTRLSGTIASIMIYGLMGDTLRSTVSIAIAEAMGDDDEADRLREERRKRWSVDGFKNGFERGIVSTASSVYGTITRGALLAAVSIRYAMEDDKKEKEKIKEWSEVNLYDSPLKFSVKDNDMNATVRAIINLTGSWDALERLYKLTVRTYDSIEGIFRDVEAGKKVEELPPADREAYEAAYMIYNVTTFALGAFAKAPVPERATFDKVFRQWKKNSQTITEKEFQDGLYNKELMAVAEEKLVEKFPIDANGMPVLLDEPYVQSLIEETVKDFRLTEKAMEGKSDDQIHLDKKEKVTAKVQSALNAINASRGGRLAGGKSEVAYTDLLNTKGVAEMASVIMPNNRSYAYSIPNEEKRDEYYLSEATKLAELGIIEMGDVNRLIKELRSRYEYVTKKEKERKEK